MNQHEPIRIGHSACPHDCPSTCALDVEILGPDRIGRVYGAKENTYTAGVICAKVARYSERIHHPDRLLKPLVRAGGKGEGGWKEASWEAALESLKDLQRVVRDRSPPFPNCRMRAGNCGGHAKCNLPM